MYKNKAQFLSLLICIPGFILILFISPWSSLIALSAIQWLSVFLAGTTALVASALRAFRTKTILDFVSVGPFRFQFLNLAVGSLVNAAAPFRFGEIVRSIFLAKQLRIGVGFTLVAIAMERLVDVLIVMSFFLTVAHLADSNPDSVIHQYAIVTLLLALIFFLFLFLSFVQNRILLGVLWKFTNFWNPRLSLRLKMSFWNLTQGFQNFFRSKRSLMRYSALTLASWSLYFFAVVILFWSFNIKISQTGLVIPFVAPESLFRVSDLESLLKIISAELFEATGSNPFKIAQFVSIMWLVLNIPISVVGLIGLCLPKLYRPVVPVEKQGQQLNYGETDLELERFLDSFFKRESMARAIQRHSRDGSSRILGFFKGGSDALTTLTSVDGAVVVRKLVSKEFEGKLKMQYEWLKHHQKLGYVISPIRETTKIDSYSIDLRFSPAVGMFWWIHSSPVAESERLLSSLLSSLDEDVYHRAEIGEIEQRIFVNKYLKECLFDRLEMVKSRSPRLKDLVESPALEINGTMYTGLTTAFEQVLSDSRVLKLLESYQPTKAIHGDLTIDNMLVDNQERILLIDPSDDNPLRGPVIDYSRLLQSLDGGYEFLNQLQPSEVQSAYSAERNVWTIKYPEKRSAQYEALAQSVRRIASRHLTDNEIEALDLHIAIMYARMTNHRLSISPETVEAYLATSVVFLDRFANRNG